MRSGSGFGGTYSIESPAPYSAIAKALIEELGIDVPSYPKYVNKDLYRSSRAEAAHFLRQGDVSEPTSSSSIRRASAETRVAINEVSRRSGAASRS